MNLNLLDWTIVAVVILFLIGLTLYSKRYCRSISDFLAANRLAGRYLLTVTYGFGGAISLVAAWQITYNNGLPSSWWTTLGYPTALFIALSGFVIYRYRETRALTMAQFFEMRYSRKFRLFSGFLCWLSGLLNYGIFPMITARFIVYFFGIPEYVDICGFSVASYPLVMASYLLIAVFIACVGGQISIMLTDFFQGILLLFIFLVMMFYLMYRLGGFEFWDNITSGLLHNAQPGNSMINPFDTAKAKDFNIWFYLINMFGSIYTVRAWQGHSAYNAAARTPHDAVMGGIIAQWRLMAYTLTLTLLPLAAYAVLKSPLYPELTDVVNAKINSIADPQIRNEMTVPMFILAIMPHGLLGLFAVIVVACAISCDDTYMHAWGSIFVQDVLMSFRKKPFTPKMHMILLRCAIVGVALFGFLWSCFFQLKDFIQMYFAITAAIYMGGAGSVIIGGLYWKRGSTPAAWTAMISGTVLGMAGIVLQSYWKVIQPMLTQVLPHCQWLIDNPDKFPINGQYVYLITMLSSIALYILVSLLGPKHVHNLDKMLYRGEYADEKSSCNLKKEKLTFSSFIGINSNFSKFDRFLAWASTCWSMGWFFLFVIICIIALTVKLSDRFWVEFWWWKMVPFSVVLGVICTIWLGYGGIRDVFAMLKELRTRKVDDSDNGFVVKDNEENE